MVLGLSAKNRKEGSIHVNYLIHIQEIKPWPPSQSLRSVRSVLIQWENGDRHSGSTKTVVPSLGSVVGEGKIEFNESFRLPVTLVREMNVKNKDADTFQKNCLELNLYEPRREKTTLLATAIVDLAEYGIVKEIISVNVPMNSKRSFRNTAQPVLFAKIQPVDKATSRTSSLLRDGLLKETAPDENGGESVSALMNEEYAEEAETASFTDDDVSSHSSANVSSSATESNNGLPSQNEENGRVTFSDSTGLKKENTLGSKLQLGKSNMKSQIIAHENQKTSSQSSSINLSPERGSLLNGHDSASNSPISSPFISNNVNSPTSSFTKGYAEEEASMCMRSNGSEGLTQEVPKKLCNGKYAINGNAEQCIEEFVSNNFQAKLSSLDSRDTQANGEGGGKTLRTGQNSTDDATNSDDDCSGFMEDIQRIEQEDNELERESFKKKINSTGSEPLNFYSQDATRNQVLLGSDALSSGSENLGNLVLKGNILRRDKLKHVKSVRSSPDGAKSNGLVTNNLHKEVKENGVLGDAHGTAGNFMTNERKETKVYPNNARSAMVDSKIQLLENKIKKLEAELREAAAIEAALYSVVAEHGSSMSKVHAPARRLSRLYLHACKESSLSRKANAARTAVSGLILVAKACGNDVPRLTFWLSNSVVLRAIISEANGGTELSLSTVQSIEKNGSRRENNKISSPLKWKESSPTKRENRNAKHGSVGGWEEPHAFSSALEKVEAWIFSRIVESIWWQTLTPHMHAASAKPIDKDIGLRSRRNSGSTSGSGDQDQVNFSLDHWKMAFKDACERLCPVRAEGHECGCLPLLSRMIMEQCIARLDVAMFNAILRESTDEIPSDPVSDPISDSKVLPIPAGKASFGAGAQLKNAIGNWSRWLSDLFGMDDDDSLQNENNHDENEERQDTSLKSFHLLNALSDLMMLPKDMLLSRSIRKEVCPAFGTPLIKRVLDNFVPDEFCPDPIPDVVLEALNSEDPLEVGEESVTNFPCIAAPPLYTTPSAAAVTNIVGEIGNKSQLRRSGSSVVRKSYTSDDELDELNYPLSSIFIDGSRSSPVPRGSNWISKENKNHNAVRYELLRDIWMDSA